MSQSRSSRSRAIRIAVATCDTRGLEAMVAQQFGHCTSYTFVEVEYGILRATRVLESPFHLGLGARHIQDFVTSGGASVLLTGKIGRRAERMLAGQGLRISVGHLGTVREAVHAWLAEAVGEDATPRPHDGSKPAGPPSRQESTTREAKWGRAR